MKNPLFVCFAGILFLFSCSKSSDVTLSPGPDTTTYRIAETFESGTKTAYAPADVSLLTGSWNFDDALIGNLNTDHRNGNFAVRLRTGSISMNFDIAGVKMLYVKHAKYGNDADSQWQLMVSADGGSNYTQLGNTVEENNTTLKLDSFTVPATGKVRFKIMKTGTARINLDDITFKGTGDPGITVGVPDNGDEGDGGDGGDNGGGTGGGRGTPDGSATDVPPATGENSNLYLGNPSDAHVNVLLTNNYLVDMKYYTESYSSTRGTPNWVSWHLDASNITQAAGRQDNFAAFTDLPTGWYEVQNTSYSGSGFDRGHNCPSADRTSSVAANSATFLMTNMIPQAPNNNQHTWANFENYLRTLVVEGNELYIIMGSYGTGGAGSKGAANTINNGHVNVPSNVWKVAVVIPAGTNDLNRITSGTRVIAVNTPNINDLDGDWKKYRVTVRDIESATGYNLLSSLPAAVQNAVETVKDNAN